MWWCIKNFINEKIEIKSVHFISNKSLLWLSGDYHHNVRGNVVSHNFVAPLGTEPASQERGQTTLLLKSYFHLCQFFIMK